jgi:antirestriction protein
METTQTSADCRVYIACLAAYNAGILHGKWVDVDGLTVDELQEEINAVLAASPEEGAEEWAIHDHEGFHGLIKGEWPDLQEVCTFAELIAEHGEAVAIYGAHIGADADGLGDSFQDAYCGQWDSFQEYVEQACDDIGYLENVPEHIKFHIDWESVAREWSYEHFEGEATGGGVHVFRSC